MEAYFGQKIAKNNATFMGSEKKRKLKKVSFFKIQWYKFVLEYYGNVEKNSESLTLHIERL